jgi:hypothetical protein
LSWFFGSLGTLVITWHCWLRYKIPLWEIKRIVDCRGLLGTAIAPIQLFEVFTCRNSRYVALSSLLICCYFALVF